MKRLLVSALAFFAAAPAMAADASSPLWYDYVTPYIGIYDVTNNDARNLLQFGGEYRFRQWDFGVRPTLGLNVDVKGGAYFYGGVNWEVGLGQTPFILIPNFMVGAYHHGGSKDLGGALEFRSGLELDYQLPNTHRIGVAFNHISNASIYRHNPGAEAVLVNYSLPASTLLGR